MSLRLSRFSHGYYTDMILYWLRLFIDRTSQTCRVVKAQSKVFLRYRTPVRPMAIIEAIWFDG